MLKTDASCFAIANLTVNGKLVAFVSHEHSDQELNWSAIEKEAFAIVLSVQNCRRYLLGSHFTILTDQEGVLYLFDSKPRSSIKNSKFCRWRLVLPEYVFDVQYRNGKLNVVADAMSRVSDVCSQSDETSYDVIYEKKNKMYIAGDINLIHKEVKMGHPGIVRTVEFIQRNFDVPNLKQMAQDYISKCFVCLELKPKFFKLPYTPLIRSKQLWERLSLDIVGPKKPTPTGNKYFLTVVDEFSRFPLALSVKEANKTRIISTLSKLFSIFGPPLAIHIDRGSVFESSEIESFLDCWNVCKTRTTPYIPAGNGQCERLSGIIWKTVKLRLKQLHKPAVLLDEEIPQAVCNIRCLSSRAIGFESPHNHLFGFTRRSSLDQNYIDLDKSDVTPTCSSSKPEWMSQGSAVFMKHFTMKSKDDSLVQPARILRLLSPQHAVVSYPKKNRIATVATKFISKGPEPDPANTS